MVSGKESGVSLLLPYYLDESFARLFEGMGFEVLWSESREETAKIVSRREPDLAFEWQHGRYDYPICDLLGKYGRSTPVVLALNWNARMIPVPEYAPIAGVSPVPFQVTELMRMFRDALPGAKRDALSQLWPEVGDDGR